MEIDDSLRQILWELPYSGRENQLKTIATYFEAKKTQGKVKAADTAGINHETGTKIEEAYEKLTQKEKIELRKALLQKQIEDSGQVEADQEGLIA